MLSAEKYYCIGLTFCLLFPAQLEEANRTLTSDVANLANEKEELNNKLKETLEGKFLPPACVVGKKE